MKRIVGLWWVHLILCVPTFAQVDTTFIYNTSMPYGTLDIRIAKSATRYYFLQEDITFSYRESSPGVRTWTYKDMTAWNSAPFRQGNLRERIVTNAGTTDNFVMNYRFLMPLNYNPNYDPGYPIILMMHGLGERGNCWDERCYWSTPSWNPITNSPAAPTAEGHQLLNNDHNLLHGGQKHLDAVQKAAGKLPNDPTLLSNAFPGFVVFPQNLNGWGSAPRVEDVIRILRLIIKKYNIDENRVYIHGLSNGGGAVYQAIKRAPWLFACALPMSAINNGGIITENLQAEVGKIPIWTFQGGKDKNPTPSRTYNTVKAFRDAGAVIRYSYYAHLGHGTWNTAYNEKDFFPWILAKRKYNPHVYYGNPVICNTTGAGVRIAFSNGFRAYQWEQDGQIIPGATGSEIVANTPATYRGRFSRKANPQESDWEPWSDPIVVTEISPAQPKIVPLTSTHLRGPGVPASEVNNTVVLESRDTADLYTWYKNEMKIDFPITDIDDTLRTAKFYSSGTGGNGAYTLKTWYSYCPSPSSEPLNLFYNNSAPQNISLTPGSVDFKGAIQGSGVFLTWNDVLSSELAYEIWRRKAGTSEFKFAGRTDRDGISFIDSPLEPLTTYEYKLRAVNNTGASNYIPSNDLNVNYQITTPADEVAPSAPQDLRMVHNDIHEVTLAWKPALDNTGIREYIINYNGTSISTDTAVTTFTITNLQQNISFPVTVKAVDHGGNISPESNTIIASTYVLGLFYKHSTGGWEDLDDTTLTETWINPEFTGHVNNITLAPRTQEDFFNFQFTGYLDITREGDYVFQVTSNDGGRLLLDNATVVDVDGTHGNVTLQSNTLHMLSGPHKFEVQYFEYAGGQTLTVQYKGPDSNEIMKILPDSVFRSGKYIQPAATPPPTNLTATAAGLQRVDLAWQVNDGLKTELYRAELQAGPFEIIAKTESETFVDTTNLLPQKTYYYKARAVSQVGLSEFTAVVSASTGGDAEPPSVPQNLAATNISHTSATISWEASTDNGEVQYYEVYQNGALKGTSELTAFTLTELLPTTQYTVTVKAVDQNNNKSDFSAALVFSTSTAAIFYSKSTGNLNDIASWSATLDGTGSTPANFEDNAQFFVVANRTQTTMGGPLTISGSASKLIVSAGVSLTVDHPLEANMDVEGNASVVLLDPVGPALQNVSSTSTIEFTGPSFIPSLHYGNLILSGDGVKTLESDTTRVEADFVTRDSALVKGSAGNASKLVVHGNINIENMDIVASDNRIDLELTDNKGHSITTAGHLSFFKITIGSNSTVDIVNAKGAVKIRLGSLNGGGLSIKSGSRFNVGKNSLDLSGAATINSANETGQLSIDGGDIRITSTSGANSNLYFANEQALVDTLFVNATAPGNVAIKNTMKIAGAIKVKAGQLNAAGNITLLSTAERSAGIMEIENNGSIAGNIRVQQYLSGVGERWIGLSSPVSGVTIANWQQFFPVYGQFTGSSGAGEASVLVSNGSDLIPYPATGGSNTAPIERGKGYYTKLSNNSSITLEEVGVPFQGNVTFSLSAGSGGGTMNGWNLVGNPYASPIEWNLSADAWIRTAVSDVISIKEKKIANGQMVAQYRYFNPIIKGVKINPGEAFWVQSYASGATMTATEKAKNLKQQSFEDSVSHVIISLLQGMLSDDAYVLFTSAGTDNFDNKLDGLKRLNDGMFSFSTMQGNLSLAVNNMSGTFCSRTINLNLVNTPAGTYVIKFSKLEKLAGIGTIKLVDKYAQSTTTITASNTMYQFTVTSDAASYGANRFSAIFERQAVDLTTPQVSATSVCSNEPAVVTVTQTKPGVEYAVVNSTGTIISNIVDGGEATLELEIPTEKLQAGANHVRVQAHYPGCATQYLASEVDVVLNTSFEIVTEPEVSICTGEQAVLQATGAPAGASYNWYDENFTLIDSVRGPQLITTPVYQEKVYYVSGILSSGCESSKKQIHVFADTLAEPVIIVNNDTLYAQGEGSNFQWKQGSEIIPGADKPFFKPFGSGTYSVVVSIGGCVKESNPYNYVAPINCQFNVTAPVAQVQDNCGSDLVEIQLNNTQSSVLYTAVSSTGTPLCSPVMGNGAAITIQLNGAMLNMGSNSVMFEAGFSGCESKMLATQTSFTYNGGFSVVVPAELEACPGENVVLQAAGAPEGGYYKWYDEHLNLVQGSMGTYVVANIQSPTIIFVSAMHVNGCESSKKQINISMANDSLKIVNDKGILRATGEDGGTYQWKLNGQEIYAAVDSIYFPTESGQYSVAFTREGCTTETAAIEYAITSTSRQVATEFVLNTFPVPSTSASFRISAQSPSGENVFIRIIDATGKSVYKNSYTPTEIINEVPITPEHGPLKEGIYMVIATQGKDEIRRRIIIRD
jgi:chitodextrinase